ncbi:hypothetical protein [Pedobacter sp. V48]|uniref:hypothetical protein n=1 Tax=Pedobacter sp. V48 TaxID=509635 RepID=UPI0012693D29|nr:hypothetical protein [Pedobacter sp. V48]
MKIIPLLSCFIMLSIGLKGQTSNGVYSDALKYILENKSFIEWDKKTDVNIYLSEEVICFKMASVLPDLIFKNYIKGFSMFHISSYQQPIVNRVTDSLHGEDKRLNVDYINTTQLGRIVGQL